MRTVVLRVAALALLLLLSLVGVLTVRTLGRLPDTLVYFVASDAAGFRLEPVGRRSSAGTPEDLARFALAQLIAGPRPDEERRGLATALPEDLQLLDLRFEQGELVVDLSEAFERGGGQALMQGRLHQLFYTLSQPASVESVGLRIEGQPVYVFSGEGLMVSQPWRRNRDLDLPRW